MDSNIDSADATKTVINCEPILGINYAETLHKHLQEAMSNQHVVEINAGEVTKVDTAILQVFLVFLLEAKATELDVNWLSISEAFRKAVDLLGLSAEMDLPQAA